MPGQDLECLIFMKIVFKKVLINCGSQFIYEPNEPDFVFASDRFPPVRKNIRRRGCLSQIFADCLQKMMTKDAIVSKGLIRFFDVISAIGQSLYDVGGEKANHSSD